MGIRRKDLLPGRPYRIIKEHSHRFLVGSLVFLEHDDGSTMPLFRGEQFRSKTLDEHSITNFVPLHCLGLAESFNDG